MARCVIIGCSEPFSVKDKDTGKSITMLRVYACHESMDTFGQKSEEILLTSTNGGYSRVSEFADNIADIIGMECDIDRNSKGKLENFVLIVPSVLKKEAK